MSFEEVLFWAAFAGGLGYIIGLLDGTRIANKIMTQALRDLSK